MELPDPFEQTTSFSNSMRSMTWPTADQSAPNMFDIAFHQDNTDSELVSTESNLFYQDYGMIDIDNGWGSGYVDPSVAHPVAEMHTAFEPAYVVESREASALVPPPFTLSSSVAMPDMKAALPERATLRRIRRSVAACIFCADRKAKCDEDLVQCGQCKIRGVECVRPSKSEISPTTRSTATEARRASIATVQTGDNESLMLRPQRRTRRAYTPRKPRPARLELQPQPSLSSTPVTSPDDVVSPVSESSAVVSFHNHQKLLDLLTNETAGTAQNVLLRLRQTKDVVQTIEDFGEGRINKVKLPALKPTGLSLEHLPKLTLPVVPGMAGMGTPSFEFNEFVNGSPQCGGLSNPGYSLHGGTGLTPNYFKGS